MKNLANFRIKFNSFNSNSKSHLGVIVCAAILFNSPAVHAQSGVSDAEEAEDLINRSGEREETPVLPHRTEWTPSLGASFGFGTPYGLTGIISQLTFTPNWALEGGAGVSIITGTNIGLNVKYFLNPENNFSWLAYGGGTLSIINLRNEGQKSTEVRNSRTPGDGSAPLRADYENKSVYGQWINVGIGFQTWVADHVTYEAGIGFSGGWDVGLATQKEKEIILVGGKYQYKTQKARFYPFLSITPLKVSYSFY